MSKKAYICGDCVFGNEPNSRACFECIYNSNFRQKNRISYNTISDGLKAGLNGSIRAKIENVVFNDPATIVFWSDNTKTVVKTQNGETFDPEKGLAMAIAKKALGNEGNYFNEIKKWTEPFYEKTFVEPLMSFNTDNVYEAIKKEAEKAKKDILKAFSIPIEDKK